MPLPLLPLLRSLSAGLFDIDRVAPDRDAGARYSAQPSNARLKYLLVTIQVDSEHVCFESDLGLTPVLVHHELAFSVVVILLRP